MKKLLLLSIVLSMQLCIRAEDNPRDQEILFIIEQVNFPRSFMYTRPIYRNIAAMQSWWHNIVFNNGRCNFHGFQAIAFFQQSIKADKTARYFLFNRKSVLTVKGDAIISGNPFLRDIRAEWLGLSDDFNGSFTINPKQKQAAIVLEFKQDLQEILCHKFFKPFWVGALLPIQWIENNVNISQIILTPSTTPIHNIIEALNQPSWQFAKFNGKKSKTGVGELMLKLGTRFLDHDYFQLGMYSGIVFPCQGPQNAEFVFDPFIGNNRHFGYVTGGTLQLPLNCPCPGNDFLVSFFVEIENIYFFRHSQFRTLDLRFKPWSRYLLLNQNTGVTNVPGVNVLTHKVHVRPYNIVDLSTGFRFNFKNIEAEIGYNLWAHGQERVKFHGEDPFPEDIFGIAGDGALVPGTNIAATASKSTIAAQAPNDVDAFGNPTFVPIRVSDINLQSGATADALAHRVHIDIGYITTGCNYDFFIGVGGFGEVSQTKSALNNWGVWFKIGGAV